jgi:hypothetical protein
MERRVRSTPSSTDSADVGRSAHGTSTDSRDYNVHRVGIVGHRLHALDPKSSRRHFLRQFGCEVLHGGDRLLALVNPPHIEAGAYEKMRFSPEPQPAASTFIPETIRPRSS